MENSGLYFCTKCNMIPSIHLVPKDEEIKIFYVCKCSKNYIKYKLFHKLFYKENIETQIPTNEPKPDTSINIPQILEKYKKLKEEKLNYDTELKTKLIEYHQKKINIIEKLYETNKKIDEELGKICKNLIFSYNQNNLNSTNISNILTNIKLNSYYKRKLKTDLNEILKLNDMQFLSFQKECFNYFNNQYTLCPEISEIKTISYLSGHDDSINCFIELNKNIGISCSRDTYINIYDLEKNKLKYKFKAHGYNVNWICKLSNNQIISCGEDSTIKIWTIIIDDDIINQKTNNGAKSKIEIKPFYEFKTKENIKKILKISENELITFSNKGIYLYEYNISNKENIKFNLLKNKQIDKLIDLFLFNQNNKNILIGHKGGVKLKDSKTTGTEIFWLDLKELKEINKIQLKGYFSQNCITQLNNEEIICGDNNKINIININTAQIKISKKVENGVCSLFKLKDGTLVKGERDGIRRFSGKTLEELPPLIQPYDDYDDDHEAEYLNYLYELSVGKIILCFKNSLLRLCKLKTG